jgi:hypothetical protein
MQKKFLKACRRDLFGQWHTGKAWKKSFRSIHHFTLQQEAVANLIFLCARTMMICNDYASRKDHVHANRLPRFLKLRWPINDEIIKNYGKEYARASSIPKQDCKCTGSTRSYSPLLIEHRNWRRNDEQRLYNLIWNAQLRRWVMLNWKRQSKNRHFKNQGWRISCKRWSIALRWISKRYIWNLLMKTPWKKHEGMFHDKVGQQLISNVW